MVTQAEQKDWSGTSRHGRDRIQRMKGKKDKKGALRRKPGAVVIRDRGAMTKPYKLQLDLVPRKLWEYNLRSQEHGLGQYRWRKLRSALIDEHGCACSICGSDERLHGHEVWRYQEKKRSGLATLEKIELICRSCHNVMHWGHTLEMLAAGVFSPETEIVLRRHFCRVNKCRQIDFKRHVSDSFVVWRRRSKLRWRVDWGPYRQAIEAAKTARAARRQRQHDLQDAPGVGRTGG